MKDLICVHHPTFWEKLFLTACWMRGSIILSNMCSKYVSLALHKDWKQEGTIGFVQTSSPRISEALWLTRLLSFVWLLYSNLREGIFLLVFEVRQLAVLYQPQRRESDVDLLTKMSNFSFPPWGLRGGNCGMKISAISNGFSSKNFSGMLFNSSQISWCNFHPWFLSGGCQQLNTLCVTGQCLLK